MESVMRLDDFEYWVEQRWGGNLQELDDHRYTVACLGLAGKTGEVVELLKKQLRDERLIRGDLVLELGDLLHYIVVVAHRNGILLHEIVNANVSKLVERDRQRMDAER